MPDRAFDRLLLFFLAALLVGTAAGWPNGGPWSRWVLDIGAAGIVAMIARRQLR